MRTFAWLLIAAATAATTTAAEAQDWKWRGSVKPGQWLEIKGVNGSVRAAPATGNEIVVEVTKSARRSDPDEVNLVVVPHEGGITICALSCGPQPRAQRMQTRQRRAQQCQQQ